MRARAVMVLGTSSGAGKSWLTANFPEIWLFVLGATFILVTIFLPRGVLGLIEDLTRRRKPAPPAAAGQPAE